MGEAAVGAHQGATRQGQSPGARVCIIFGFLTSFGLWMVADTAFIECCRQTAAWLNASLFNQLLSRQQLLFGL